MITLKFRAWDVQKKNMLSFSKGFTELAAFLNEEYKQNGCIEDDFQWMQFTGLLDKNGVEIYEGDILTFGADNLPVVYEAGAFRMGDTGLSGLILSDHIVIGNIYENPELVEKTI